MLRDDLAQKGVEMWVINPSSAKRSEVAAFERRDASGDERHPNGWLS